METLPRLLESVRLLIVESETEDQHLFLPRIQRIERVLQLLFDEVLERPRGRCALLPRRHEVSQARLALRSYRSLERDRLRGAAEKMDQLLLGDARRLGQLHLGRHPAVLVEQLLTY